MSAMPALAPTRLLEVKYTDVTLTTFIGTWFEWDGTAGSKYYYAGSQRIAMRNTNGTLRWLLGDHLGSTSVLAALDGTLYSRTLYNPLPYTQGRLWGEVRYQSGTLPTKYTYTGQYSHTDDTSPGLSAGFGLMFYVARWDDPVLGRFAQADTLVPGAGNPLAYDRYNYTLNNPVKYVDPNGHAFEPPCAQTGSCSNGPSYQIDYSDLGLGRVGNALAMTVIELVASPVCWFYLGCHVDWVENTLTGPTQEEMNTAQVMGLGNSIAIVYSPWAPQLGNIFQNFTAGSFRTNLQRLMGLSDEAVNGLQAHHVLPQALESRFSKLGLGINIHDPHFGAWVGPEHQNWTTAYPKEWEAWLDSFVDRTPTLDELFEQAARMAQKYGFEWTPPGSQK